jgi:hypothetical protein
MISESEINWNVRRWSCFNLKYLFTLRYLLSSSIENSPWEANRFSASQQILHILWNPKVHYPVYKSTPLVRILSQINAVHAPISHFLKIHLRLGLPCGLFPSSFPVCTSPLPHTCYMHRSSHSSWFDHPNNILRGVQIVKLQCVILQNRYFSERTAKPPQPSIRTACPRTEIWTGAFDHDNQFITNNTLISASKFILSAEYF